MRAATGAAFPTLCRGGGHRLAIVHRGRSARAALLDALKLDGDPLDGPGGGRRTPGEVVRVRLDAGIAVELDAVGLLEDDRGTMLMHGAGLPAGIPVSLAEFTRFRASVSVCSPPEHGDSDGSSAVHVGALGGAALAEAAAQLATKGFGGGDALVTLLLALQLKHTTAAGAARAEALGSSLAEAVASGEHTMRSDFSYHVGLGPHTQAVAVDRSDETCKGFFGVRAGAKVLSPLGVAACVGVASLPGAVGERALPQLLWHVSGARGASVAPALHIVPHIAVGDAPLEINGPHAMSLLLQPEDPTRYLCLDADVGRAVGRRRGTRERYDTTEWLCGGLFGCTPGEPHPAYPAALEVLGVGRADLRDGLDLFCRHRATGDVCSLTEWSFIL